MKSCRPLLGTYVDIRVDHPDAARAANALMAGFAAIEKVQRLMSVFDEHSDISRINRQAHQQSVRVDAWTADVLRLALSIHAASAGLFDCGIAPRLADWGMLPATDDMDYRHSSLSKLHIDSDNCVTCDAPTRLDLGGIAKGYAVDRAAEAILQAGAEGGLINAGGDLRVFGAAEEAIYLRDPGRPQQLHFAGHLQDGACATSATYFSRRPHGSGEVSALVHPQSGRALLSQRSYSVIAPSCSVADALTKVLALGDDPEHPCFARFAAHPFILSPAPDTYDTP